MLAMREAAMVVDVSLELLGWSASLLRLFLLKEIQARPASMSPSAALLAIATPLGSHQ